ncbi:hypothetical protein HNP48_002259 [Acidovorax soli]|uniref:Phage P22-like portal protein n=1 Tax=Acidovorax soli TaxID=592050 RepID=A0A7X0U8U0_9BURK|nr:hypothetical protein [Acidovorax soli]MBB6559592.1 hypothetical protein [Acidovorax soli]
MLNHAHDTAEYDEDGAPLTPEGDVPLTLAEYTDIIREIEAQPPWRGAADREMDYADGNQLNSDLLRANADLGIPPAVEDKTGPMMLALQGYETAIRTDWRVKPNGNAGGQDVADALNFKLNEAERHSKADRACSDAFRPQAGVGLGWVEVSRSSDPFEYPYQCVHVHRNEIHWDWASKKDLLEDARYLRRLRWMHPSRLLSIFKEHRELIKQYGKYGASWWSTAESIETLEGGASTGLRNSWNQARGWTVAEDRFYNPLTTEVCVAEVWYRRWVEVGVLTSPDGRVVEYDENNQAHNYAIATGTTKYTLATVARVRRSYWLGPHCLHDSPTPYAHRHFPYVPFFGFREDGTTVPYGYIRGVMYQQDSLNSGSALLRWGMGAVRTERTKGAVAMTDEQYRKQIGRRNADIVLNPAAMAQPGARHEVIRDFQLTDQQFRMLDDARGAIDRIGATPNAFTGRPGTARSGQQEDRQVDQANQGLGRMMDNHKAARTQVGELLLSMIVEDIGDSAQAVVIPGDAVSAERTIHINKPEIDEVTGYPYLSNDLQRTRLMVGVSDAPSSSTYQGQQLNALSEATKSMPPQYQSIMAQYLVALTDIPFKDKITEALRAAAQQETPEQIEARIAQAVQDALDRSGLEVKMREIALKEKKGDAEIEKLMREAVNIGVQTAFSAMQTGTQVAQMPMIAPIADKVMQGAGWRPTPGGVDPNIPVADTTAAMNIKSPYIQGEGPELEAEAGEGAATEVRQNTSPQFPPVPQDGPSAMQGIETSSTADNLQAA